MTTPSLSDIRRAMCCPGTPCCSPSHCYAARRGQLVPVVVPVDIHAAASAVAQLYIEAWRNYGKQPGPYSVERKHGES